jgi:hypothetical protein
MSPQELRTGYNKICNKIYSLSNIAKRCIRGFKYLKNLNHSFLAFPLINYTYRKLYSIGKTEQIWKYLNKDLPDLLFKKLIKIKSYFEENKKNIKNRNQDLNVHNLKKIYGKLARKIGRIEKYILRENIEKVSKKLKYCLAFINQKISKLKRYGKHDSALKQIEESKKIIKNLYSMII